ncbi:MAG: S9 family peptidase [Acidobacteria bacterium]|nr:S9 family peptidase [Acidobacteriota bacterium]
MDNDRTRAGRLCLASLILCLCWPVLSPSQEPPARPGAQAAREPTPEQKEIQQLQDKIGEIQQRIQELRIRGSAERYQRDIERKKQDDERIAELCERAVDFEKVTYRSSVDGLPIPAYLFQPMEPRGAEGHPALIWVHGGVHSSFSSSSIPFIREAVERGYIVIAPDFRGSTGYGEEFQEAIDYGGYEIDDTLSAIDYLKADLPHVDPDRIGMIGWSHGGFITLHSLARDQGKILKCGYAGVPVTNLIFRLSFKGPNYEANFIKQKRIGGEVHEKRDIYVERSPVYHVDKIRVPVLVHVSTNDQDVNFVEDQMMIHALQYHIPHLAQTRIYVDPQGGHSFDRLVNRERTAPINTPHQRDSWNRIWAFLEWNLKPYLDGEGRVVSPGTAEPER